MEILLLIVAWLLVGCGIAWVMGAANSTGDAPGGIRGSGQHARDNFNDFTPGEGASGDAGAGLSTAGTDRRGLCDSRAATHRTPSASEN